MKKLLSAFAAFVFAIYALAFAELAQAQFADQRQYAAQTTGSANAQSVNIPNYAFNPGVVVRFRASFSNTGAMTLNVNNLGSVAVEKFSPTGLTPLTGGEIVQGQIVEVSFDGAEYQFLNSAIYPGNSLGLLTFEQTDTHAQIRSALTKMQETVSVTDWIPQGTNCSTTDCSQYFQYASQDACARTSLGVHFYIPPGTYIVHDITNSCPNNWEGAGRSLTTINYANASSFGFQWSPVSFPLIVPTQTNFLNGGQISNLTMNDSTSDNAHTGLVAQGVYDWSAHDITFNNPYNGITMYGAEFPATYNVSMYSTRGQNYTFKGDLNGWQSSGVSCSATTGNIAVCSTRSDAWYFSNLVNIDNTYSNTGITIIGFVSDIVGYHTNFEGPNEGLVISCPVGFSTTLSQCPQHIFIDDDEVENCNSYCVHALDFNQLKLTRSYFYGTVNGSPGTGTPNTIYFGSLNYNGTTPPVVGRVLLQNNFIFVANSDCVYQTGTTYEIAIIGKNEINGCNGSNNGSGVINFSGTAWHDIIADNGLGSIDGYTGTNTPVYAVSLGNNVAWADVHDNNFDGLLATTSPVVSTSSFPGTIHVHDNLGPGSTAPVISACGTSPSFANIATNEQMTVTVGTGTPTSCTLTFSNPFYQNPTCVFSVTSGASATSVSLSNSTISVTLHGSALSGSYQILCRAP